ncbi:hypothetical protein APHAL10511_000771 [Amanita phalloides]|nr:hypothetical protein APHAL10511_000771 [Amanita phalloides]
MHFSLTALELVGKTTGPSKLQTKRGICCHSLVARKKPIEKSGVGGIPTEVELEAEVERMRRELAHQGLTLQTTRDQQWERAQTARIARMHRLRAVFVELKESVRAEPGRTNVQTEKDRLEERMAKYQRIIARIDNMILEVANLRHQNV